MQSRKGKLFFIISISLLVLAFILEVRCYSVYADSVSILRRAHSGEDNMDNKVVKSDEEWIKVLTPEQFAITREKGTEAPFSGEYNNFKEKGVFLCVCCGNRLFASETKFDSGSGWPSFMAPVSENSIKYKSDNSMGMKRVELMCNRCGAHLGHVFDDGPPPLNKRHCINSLSLKFEQKN